MALRIKSHWHNEEAEKSLQDIAGAVAFIAWKIALDKAINLHGEDFIYDNDAQRMDVIGEYLIFQVQVTDRVVAKILNEQERRSLVTALALRIADYVQDNSSDMFGPGDYKASFIDKLNQRSTDYSELGFTDEGPSYPFLRQLGYEIQGVMGGRHENRWVIDQVMDGDAPEVTRHLVRAIRDLFE